MELTQSEPETKRELELQALIKVANELNDLKLKAAPLENVRNLFQSEPKQESRVDKAKRIAQEVANASKALDKAVIDCGNFFEEILASDLSNDQINEKLEANNYPKPEDHEYAIPNSASEFNLNKFDLACQLLTVATPKDLNPELKTHAMFLMSLVSSLIFERSLLENELLRNRQGRRNAIAELMKQQHLNQYKATLRR